MQQPQTVADLLSFLQLSAHAAAVPFVPGKTYRHLYTHLWNDERWHSLSAPWQALRVGTSETLLFGGRARLQPILIVLIVEIVIGCVLFIVQVVHGNSHNVSCYLQGQIVPLNPSVPYHSKGHGNFCKSNRVSFLTREDSKKDSLCRSTVCRHSLSAPSKQGLT